MTVPGSRLQARRQGRGGCATVTVTVTHGHWQAGPADKSAAGLGPGPGSGHGRAPGARRPDSETEFPETSPGGRASVAPVAPGPGRASPGRHSVSALGGSPGTGHRRPPGPGHRRRGDSENVARTAELGPSQPPSHWAVMAMNAVIARRNLNRRGFGYDLSHRTLGSRSWAVRRCEVQFMISWVISCL